MALAWGVLMAGVVQFLFPLPFLQRLHLLPRPRWDWGDEGVRRILTLMIPALFGVSVSQINLLLDTVLASFLPTGSISWLYYSDRLMELPLGVFAVAIGTVILPSLSRHKAGSDQQAFAATLDWGLRSVLLLALPAAAALMVLAEPILVALFQYGELKAGDVAMSVYSLQAYSLGLVAFMLIKVLAPGFFARQDTRTPVRIGIVAMVANMVLNLVFVLPLHHYFQLGHVGLALATSCSAWLNAMLLLRGLLSRGAYGFQPGWGLFWLRAVVAVAAMVVALLLGSLWLGELAQWAAWQRAWRLLTLCALGAVVYGGVLVLMGVRLRHFRGLS